MMVETCYRLLLLLNALWFGSAFWYFALKHETAAKLLVPRTQRSSPLFSTLSAALPFLGGMNLALALLALMLLASPQLFVAPAERCVLLVAFAVAHTTQFWINVPIARRGGRVGEAYWDVLSGPMLFIFVVDALMLALNFTLAGVLAL